MITLTPIEFYNFHVNKEIKTYHTIKSIDKKDLDEKKRNILKCEKMCEEYVLEQLNICCKKYKSYNPFYVVAIKHSDDNDIILKAIKVNSRYEAIKYFNNCYDIFLKFDKWIHYYERKFGKFEKDDFNTWKTFFTKLYETLFYGNEDICMHKIKFENFNVI